MGRLKLYALIAGLALIYFGSKRLYDTITSESTPFEMKLSDVEKKGVGEHKFVKITGALPVGTFVYKYSEKKGVKGNVDYIIYPVISESRIMENQTDDTTVSDFKAKVVVKLDTSFSESLIDNFKLDTTYVTIEGMVRAAEDIDSEERRLLDAEGVSIEKEFIYIVKEAPKSYTSGIGMLVGGLLLTLLAVIGFLRKSE